MFRCFLLIVILLTTPCGAMAGIEDSNGHDDSKLTEEKRIQGYLRPYLGWGWRELSAQESQLSRYRLGVGLATGISRSRFSLGLDFNYYNGTHFQGGLRDDPTVQGVGRTNAFRLAADAGYELGWKWIILRPHIESGVEWRRLNIGDNFLRYTRSAFWAPCLLALVPMHADRLFAIGVDLRWNMILIDGSVYNQLGAFLAFESKF